MGIGNQGNPGIYLLSANNFFPKVVGVVLFGSGQISILLLEYKEFKSTEPARCNAVHILITPQKECFLGYTGISSSMCVHVSICVQNTSFY